MLGRLDGSRRLGTLQVATTRGSSGCEIASLSSLTANFMYVRKTSKKLQNTIQKDSGLGMKRGTFVVYR
jgi:hypothetical protein